MRDHLRNALLETRNYLLKQKAGKYNEAKDEDEKDELRMASKASSDSGSVGDSPKQESPNIDSRSGKGEDDLDKEIVTFFRKKKPARNVREAVVGLGKR